MKKKHWFFVFILTAIALYYFNKETPSSNKQLEDREELKKEEKKVFHKLKETQVETHAKASLLPGDLPHHEEPSFEQVKEKLKVSTKKCREMINQYLPGEEKTEDIPDDPNKLRQILKAYIESQYSQDIYQLNEALTKDGIDQESLKGFINNQEEDEQCYPFVEQEVLLKILDELTEEGLEQETKREYRDIVLDYLKEALNFPQSLFHLASYLNIVQVMAQKNLIESRVQFDVERLRSDVMRTVRDTDEELIKSLRDEEMTQFVDTHRRRFEATNKIKQEFRLLYRDIRN